jgi:hypothetical protein
VELIDRYLQSVKWMLPRKEQEDVIRELADEILSRAEEKEVALGRPLTEDEQVALLKQLGHPMLVASRYRKQRYLIDPAIFAVYWMVLRLVLGFALFGIAVAAVAVAASGQGLGKALGILFRYPLVALSAFAWVTLVFVVLDIIQVKCDFFSKWDPRSLPKLSKKQPRHSMLESFAALIFGAIFGVWWLVGLKHQFWIFGPGVYAIHFGPVWQTLYPLFVVLVVADVVRHTIEILRPGWDKGRLAFRLFFRGMNLLVLYFLLNATDLLVAGEALPAQQQPVIKNLNQAIHIGIAVAAIITVIQTARDLYMHFVRGRENGQRAVACL